MLDKLLGFSQRGETYWGCAAKDGVVPGERK